MSRFHQPPATYVRDVSIKVQDLSRSVAYYQQVIGLKVLKQTDRQAILTADGQTPLVILEQPEGVVPKTRRSTGLYHFALLLPSRADLAVFMRHLLEMRIPVGEADHYVSEAIYLNDPDGNGIEVYRDRSFDEWSWKDNLVVMATEPLDWQEILAEGDAPWNGLPSGTIMGHIHLHVANLQEAIPFYRDGLGFEIVSYYPQAAFLSTERYHHHIAINTWQGVGAQRPPAHAVGLKSYTIAYPTAEQRDAVVQRLIQMGFDVQQQDDDMRTWDPSGNAIQLSLHEA